MLAESFRKDSSYKMKATGMSRKSYSTLLELRIFCNSTSHTCYSCSVFLISYSAECYTQSSAPYKSFIIAVQYHTFPYFKVYISKITHHYSFYKLNALHKIISYLILQTHHTSTKIRGLTCYSGTHQAISKVLDNQ
jgi:hypothetical protein